jgi:hypothetical protein
MATQVILTVLTARWNPGFVHFVQPLGLEH